MTIWLVNECTEVETSLMCLEFNTKNGNGQVLQQLVDEQWWKNSHIIGGCEIFCWCAMQLKMKSCG